MTERPKRLPSILALMSALNIFDGLAPLEKQSGGYTTSGSFQKSPHRVAHDKRAARKLRNRKMNRRHHV